MDLTTTFDQIGKTTLAFRPYIIVAILVLGYPYQRYFKPWAQRMRYGEPEPILFPSPHLARLRRLDRRRRRWRAISRWTQWATGKRPAQWHQDDFYDLLSLEERQR